MQYCDINNAKIKANYWQIIQNKAVPTTYNVHN